VFVVVLNPHYTLVASNKDPASITMAKCLIDDIGFTKVENSKNLKIGWSHSLQRKSQDKPGNNDDEHFDSYSYKNVKLHLSHNRSLLHLDNLDELYPESMAFVFLSKHSSESGIPTLTCHFTGNFSNSNPYGGIPRELGIAYPHIQKSYIRDITSKQSFVSEYDIIIEATHHGPTSLKKPSVFIEIGSTQKQWTDRNAASVVCQSAVSILTQENTSTDCKSVGIAFGGTHYPTKLNKLLLESEFGLASIAAKYNLTSIDEFMMKQMISKSIEKITHVIVDKKGLGKEKNRILELIDKENLELLEV
jgi:D-aminoacyl-tRNA deacylase